MNRFIKICLVGCGTVLLLFSCAKEMTDVQKEKLPRRKEKELIQVLDSISHKKPDFFYTKISTDFADTNKNVSFKTSIRMVKDSAINTLITYAKIPIVNSMITTDSVKITNKRDKCYIKQSLSYIKDNFGIDFNYRNLEELILGLPLDYDTTQKYFLIHDPFTYTISSHKKREIKRLDRSERAAERFVEKDDIVLKYFLTDDAKDLKGIFIESPSDSTSITVDYISREMFDGYNIPHEVYIQIRSPRNYMRINLEYDKAEINQPQPLVFVIPEGYEKCE